MQERIHSIQLRVVGAVFFSVNGWFRALPSFGWIVAERHWALLGSDWLFLLGFLPWSRTWRAIGFVALFPWDCSCSGTLSMHTGDWQSLINESKDQRLDGSTLGGAFLGDEICEGGPPTRTVVTLTVTWVGVEWWLFEVFSLFGFIGAGGGRRRGENVNRSRPSFYHRKNADIGERWRECDEGDMRDGDGVWVGAPCLGRPWRQVERVAWAPVDEMKSVADGRRGRDPAHLHTFPRANAVLTCVCVCVSVCVCLCECLNDRFVITHQVV